MTPKCRLAKTQRHGQRETLLKIHCEQPSAVVTALINESSCLIASYAADPERRGAGRMALPIVFDHLRGLGCKDVSVSAANERAAAFWAKVGFAPTSRAPMFAHAFGNYMRRSLEE